VRVGSRQQEEPTIVELDGPQRSYFEIPLDHWATPNGELEPEGHPEAVRLSQRVVYINFTVADAVRIQTVLTRVNERLKELGGGYIWWRLRPTPTQDGRFRMRLGTTPQLPGSWWERVSVDAGNGSLDKNIPGLS